MSGHQRFPETHIGPNLVESLEPPCPESTYDLKITCFDPTSQP